MTRENNADSGKTTVYTYDNGGNILSKKEYAYTTAANLSSLTPSDTVTYTYGDSEWKDLLTAYDGQSITYDAQGNPLTYRDDMSFTWVNGRTLKTVIRNNNLIVFGYDADGLRTSKNVNGKKTEYYYDDSGHLVMMSDGTDTLQFGYNIVTGGLEGFTYNGTKYVYVYNTRGDVIGLYQIFGAQTDFLVSYEYDAWGNLISITDFQGNDLTNNTTSTLGKLAHLNPFRYRGYFYDTETGFYFLQSRYYDPQTGRFLNADAVEYLGANGDINAYNLFAYCSNDPVNFIDESGYFIKKIVDVFTKITKKIEGWIDTFKSLTDAERELIRKHPFKANIVRKCKNRAIHWTEKVFFPNDYKTNPEKADGKLSNAFKHAFWNALMTYEFQAANWALLFSTAHEEVSAADLKAKWNGFTGAQHKAMDMYNNKVGAYALNLRNKYTEKQIAYIILGLANSGKLKKLF